MRAPTGISIGYRLRYPDGRKLSITGSRTGLFFPRREYDKRELLFVVEGPTDTAALLSLNIQAVGRPSNTGGHDLLLQFCRGFSKISILADRDENPIARKLTDRAAYKLAVDLSSRSGVAVKILHPIHGKDAREWKRNGLTKQAIGSVWKNANRIPSGRQCSNSWGDFKGLVSNHG